MLSHRVAPRAPVLHPLVWTRQIDGAIIMRVRLSPECRLAPRRRPRKTRLDLVGFNRATGSTSLLALSTTPGERLNLWSCDQPSRGQHWPIPGRVSLVPSPAEEGACRGCRSRARISMDVGGHGRIHLWRCKGVFGWVIGPEWEELRCALRACSTDGRDCVDRRKSFGLGGGRIMHIVQCSRRSSSRNVL